MVIRTMPPSAKRKTFSIPVLRCLPSIPRASMTISCSGLLKAECGTRGCSSGTGKSAKDASGKDISDEKIWRTVTFLTHLDSLPPGGGDGMAQEGQQLSVPGGYARCELPAKRHSPGSELPIEGSDRWRERCRAFCGRRFAGVKATFWYIQSGDLPGWRTIAG